MTMIPSPEEIQKLLFKLNPNKAPGPDGLTSDFYKSSWSFLGVEVLSSITHFFQYSFMPVSTNSTILALVPKRPGASAISDFRPISCLNTLYKIIARLLVRRIKPILPELIVLDQTSFVKGRLIVENTVLAGELVNGYHRKTGPKRITIKVDIAKAFDTLSWEFLFDCLDGLQLPSVLITWLRACVCTPNFTIGYNGRVHGYFKGKRGLRQGDPLSPYLFVIAMNMLSLMLNKAAADLKIKYHHKCSRSKLTHLCFADDLLIFMDGSLSSVQNVLQVLKEFELWSGLAVSVQKSSFNASGLSQQEIDVIKVSTGMPNGTLPVRYLGVLLWIKMEVGNGEACRFWSDNWSPFGKLSKYLLSDAPSGMGISLRTTVADLYVEGNWRLPPPRSEKMVQLHIFFTTWASIVWIGRGIPRHNFLTWLFVLNRCPTRDRLIGWGLQTDAACLLCNQNAESRDHLFFLCPYSWTIWVEISRRCCTVMLAILPLLDLAGEKQTIA